MALGFSSTDCPEKTGGYRYRDWVGRPRRIGQPGIQEIPCPSCSQAGNEMHCELRVIARSTISRFVASLSSAKGRDAVEGALSAWYHEVRRASWKNSADVKLLFATASIVSSDWEPPRLRFDRRKDCAI